MKQLPVFVLLCSIVLALVIPSVSLGQSNNEQNKQQKLERIDREIAEAEGNKTSGMIKIAVGVGLSVVAWTSLVPTSELTYSNGQWSMEEKGSAGLYWACVGGGAILEIWGAYQWWDASSTAILLKAKRYDISFRPIIIPNKNGNMNPGLALRMNF